MGKQVHLDAPRKTAKPSPSVAKNRGPASPGPRVSGDVALPLSAASREKLRLLWNEGAMNQPELAERFGLSSTGMVSHVLSQLRDSGLFVRAVRHSDATASQLQGRVFNRGPAEDNGVVTRWIGGMPVSLPRLKCLEGT